jgi:adenine-specific DNA-methyltransferase
MSEERLSGLIEDFNYRNLNLFFRSQCENYAEAPLNLSQYDDERFRDFQKLGEIRFGSGDKLIVTSSFVSSDLSERSGKKAQYEKAKKILKEMAVYDAGFFIFRDNTGSFRFSLVYAQFQGTKRSFSNFRRFTYFVSKDQTNKTFRIRVGGCTFSSLEAVKDAFSVEKVNKEFYNHIARFFYRLTGYECKREMTLPSVSDDDKETYQEFAVRLIGRAIFCWFLKHKKSANGVSLIPESILSSEAVKQNSQYYHSTLEKLFFEVLNTPQEQRHKNILPYADKIPFLNGGLFEPHKDDFYSSKPLYNLVIPDAWFEQFFEILEQYNFTIDENSTVDADVSVDPEMLGRIFENLLAEVNPYTGETARKATGSYYTPRTIVDYMVDQSLKQYLITKTKIDEDKICALLSYEAPEIALSESGKSSIISALDEIKIIDPACGSGAFPMGILHKMLLVLQKADPDLKLWLKNHLGNIEPGIFKDRLLERIRNENWEYVRKLLIIQKSIYGVDIQTIAVEISKLRFFLSLIVDEQIDDLRENRGVEALPNLEFKFVVANSLIELPPAINRQVGLGVNEEVTKLKELRSRYLRSYGGEKKSIEEDFLKTRGKLIEHNVKWGGKDAFALQLASWNPFSYEPSGWFDPEWMFGIGDGFDIVIANPPYIFARNSEMKGLTDEDKKYFYAHYQLAEYQVNLYPLFIEKGTSLLKPNGCLCFITPNNWLTINTNKSMRKFVLSQSDIIIVNFYSRVFESSDVDSSIIIYRNASDNKRLTLCEYTDSLRLVKEAECNLFLSRMDHVINIEAFKDTGVASLIDKIDSQSVTIAQVADVKAGLVAYEVGKGNPPQTEEMKEKRVYHSTRKIDNAYIKYLDGKDVCRYRLDWSGEFLKYGDNLAAPRKDFRLYSTKRILVRQIPSKPPYCINACLVEETVLNDRNSMNIINFRESPESILGILNSRLISFWFVHKFGKMQRNTFPQFKVNELANFPLPKDRQKKQADIAKLVKQILAAKKGNPEAELTQLERQIDQMVYELYGLTPEEIAVVEGSTK